MTLPSHEIPVSSSCEIVVCQIGQSHEPIIICAVYRPPASNLDYLDEMCLILENINHSYPTATIWIGGDLNLPDVDWSLNYPSYIIERFLDFHL